MIAANDGYGRFPAKKLSSSSRFYEKLRGLTQSFRMPKPRYRAAARALTGVLTRTNYAQAFNANTKAIIVL